MYTLAALDDNSKYANEMVEELSDASRPKPATAIVSVQKSEHPKCMVSITPAPVIRGPKETEKANTAVSLEPNLMVQRGKLPKNALSAVSKLSATARDQKTDEKTRGFGESEFNSAVKHGEYKEKKDAFMGSKLGQNVEAKKSKKEFKAFSATNEQVILPMQHYSIIFLLSVSFINQDVFLSEFSISIMAEKIIITTLRKRWLLSLYGSIKFLI